MDTLVNLVKPVLFSALNSCTTKKLVVELLHRYAKTTDNDVDDLIVKTVEVALLKNCK